MINYYVSFQRVWLELRNDQLPEFSITRFGMVLFCAIVNAPTALCMEHVLETQISSSTMGMGDSNQSTPRIGDHGSQPIGEGAVASKVAKTATDGTKIFTEKVRPHVEDIGSL